MHLHSVCIVSVLLLCCLVYGRRRGPFATFPQSLQILGEAWKADCFVICVTPALVRILGDAWKANVVAIGVIRAIFASSVNFLGTQAFFLSLSDPPLIREDVNHVHLYAFVSAYQLVFILLQIVYSSTCIFLPSIFYFGSMLARNTFSFVGGGVSRC